MMMTMTTTMMIGGLLANFVTVRTLKQVNWEKDCPITTFSEKKDSQLFCKRTNNNHKFKDCFLRGQVSLNGFQILNGCIVEFYWSVCKKLENLLFLENVVIGQSNSKNPGLSVCTVTNRFPNLLRVK